MNGPRLTEAQIAKALRVHLPERAQAGLRERIMESAGATPQLRALPSFLGALSEADPVTRRRNLLIAAALLVALAFASAAAVGALRLLQRDPIEKLSLDPPPDIQAFVFSSRERLPTLPPVAMTTLDSVDGKSRVYVHRSGAVRFERYASADATEPVTYMILGGTRMGRLMTAGAEKVWVVQDETIGDDPRVFLFAPPPGPIYIGGPVHPGGPNCDMDRGPTEVGDPAAASGWRYVGVEYVAGRPTHHAACGGGDLWIDIETRLILRSRGPLIDADHEPIPGEFRTIEATEVAFGDQPAELFDFAPPQGIALVAAEEFEAYQCARDPVCSAATPEPEPTPPEPSPTPIVDPNQSDCAAPSRGPSEPTGPLAWTQASLTEDWPAPVRPEPAGGASVLSMPPTYIDPLGDTGSDGLPCIDIRDLTVGTYDVDLYLASNRPPDVDPSKAWIAYGVVVDDDRDGVPDWRYGIDNLPRTAGDEHGHHREWRTDLHTGRTEWAADSDWDKVSNTYLATGYPAEGGREGFHFSGDRARFRFGHVSDTTGGTVTDGMKVDMPLYAWASVIVDGRVVATDYAPDAGWLLPTPGAKPGGTYVLERGTYADEGVLPFRLSMSVPKGWDPLSHDLPGSDSVGLDLMIIDKPGLDACGKGGTALATIGPSADDLAAFLADQPKIKVSQSSDLTLDAYRGRYVEYTTTDSDDCDPENRPFWPVVSNHDGTREYNQTWILNVDGVRLVIDAFSSPEASENARAELRQIVESIQIEP